MTSPKNVAHLASAVVGARSRFQTLTGHSIQNDVLVRNIIDYESEGSVGKSSERRRLAMLGDMVLQTTILDNWYPTGRPVRKRNFLLFQIKVELH